MQGDLEVQSLGNRTVVRVEERGIPVQGNQARGVFGSFIVLQVHDVPRLQAVCIRQLAPINRKQPFLGPFLESVFGGRLARLRFAPVPYA